MTVGLLHHVFGWLWLHLVALALPATWRSIPLLSGRVCLCFGFQLLSFVFRMLSTTGTMHGVLMIGTRDTTWMARCFAYPTHLIYIEDCISRRMMIDAKRDGHNERNLYQHEFAKLPWRCLCPMLTLPETPLLLQGRHSKGGWRQAFSGRRLLHRKPPPTGAFSIPRGRLPFPESPPMNEGTSTSNEKCPGQLLCSLLVISSTSRRSHSTDN